MRKEIKQTKNTKKDLKKTKLIALKENKLQIEQ